METWTFGITTGAVVTTLRAVVFAIRAVDFYAFISNEDDDFEKGAWQYSNWFYNNAKKKVRQKRKKRGNRVFRACRR